MPEHALAPGYEPATPKVPADTSRVRHDADNVPCIALQNRQFGAYTMVAGAALFWSMAGLCLWIGAGVVCPNGNCRILEFDRQLLGALHALQQPWLDAILTAATWLGSIDVLLPLAVVLAFRRWRFDRHANALLPVLAVSGAWLLAHLGKLLVARPRPDLYPALISMPADLSFPSAHTMQITAFALAWVLAAGSRPGRAGVIAAALITVAVALSRLYLQVHSPSDVAIGMIAAATWVVGLRLLLSVRI